MSVPTIKLVVWADRDPAWIFVGIPNERGRYLRTHICVAHVACPNPRCLSIAGEPCKRGASYITSSHFSRRDAFRRSQHDYGDVLKK